MIGLDTGFFVEFLRANSQAVSVWKSLIANDAEAAVSCLTLFELARLGLRKAIAETATLIEAIPAVCTILSALSHGLGIPAVDSLILAGFLSVSTEIIYTTDQHLEAYRKKGVRIINLRN